MLRARAAEGTLADFPFLYFFHGELDPDRVDKVGAVALGFRTPVGERDKLRIQKSVPEAFAGFFKWSDTLFTSESMGDVFDAIVYGDRPGNVDALKEFAVQVERWALEIHEKNPLAFFIGPTPTLGDDPWESWTREQTPEKLLPFLEAYADAHPESLETDDDDLDASDPMGGWGEVNLVQMQSVLQHFDAELLGGPSKEGQARARALLERYQLGD